MSTGSENMDRPDLDALAAQAAAVDAATAAESAPPVPESAPAAPPMLQKMLQETFDETCQLFAPNWWAQGFGSNASPQLARVWNDAITAAPWLEKWLLMLAEMKGPWVTAVLTTVIVMRPYMNTPPNNRERKNASEKTQTKAGPGPSDPNLNAAH